MRRSAPAGVAAAWASSPTDAVSGVVEREAESEGRASPRLGGDHDAPAVRPRDASHGREAEAGSMLARRVERLEDAIKITPFDAAPRVRNLNDRLVGRVV